MGYRREDIPVIVRTLRAARPQSMEDGVCWAIEIARSKELITIQDLLTTKSFISQVLGRSVWLTTWIEDQGIRVNWRRMARTRRRWIDKMIRDLQQYEKEAP